MSYGDCEAACCDQGSGACSGDNSAAEAHCLGHGPVPCEADPCCYYQHAPDAGCHALECSSLGEADCADCWCDSGWTCDTTACADVSDNNPDVCEGCNTCGGNWNITDDRGNMPWNITVTNILKMQDGGGITIANTRTLQTGEVRASSTSHIYGLENLRVS